MTLKDAANQARKVLPTQYCGAVIVAAGSASRMGGIDKVMAPLGGEPMILRTVRAFEDCEAVKEIVIVTREDLMGPIAELCSGFTKIRSVVQGGSSRQESVKLGLLAPAACDRIVRLLAALGFATEPPVPAERLLAAVTKDKKSEGDTIRLVLPTAVGACEVRTMTFDELSRLVRSV